MTLMYTKTGIETTLDFLKETRIATRKWHLEWRLEVLGDEQENELGEQKQESLVESNLLD